MKSTIKKAVAAVAVLMLALSFSPLLAQSIVDNPGQTAMAQSQVDNPGQPAMEVNDLIIPRHTVLPPTLSVGIATRAVAQPNGKVILAASTPLTTWNGSFVSAGKTFNFNMVGTAPSTGTSTTIQAFVIPIKLVVGTQTFDPQTVLSNGKTVVNNCDRVAGFATGVSLHIGRCVSMGSTQYLDAYQARQLLGHCLRP